MSTLLLRLAGPMQSWGTQSRFSVRDTGLEPSKSGVIGLVCAALGRPRTEPIDDLSALRMGVRVDREGVVKVDYHTAGGTHRRGDTYGVARVDGSGWVTVPSNRYYLADASFLVGLEGDDRLLREIDAALARPAWQLFLGRKAFVPSEPVSLPDAPPLGPGLRPGRLEDALRAYRWPPGQSGPLRFVLDAAEDPDPGAHDVRTDVPLSFEPGKRSFAVRYVRTEFWTPLEEST
jgi:CRISPR system Cascade subunit CasD